MAASTVTHASSLEMTVAEGSIHCLCACAARGRTRAAQSATRTNRCFMAWLRSGIEVEVDLAKFFAALRGQVRRCFRRPLERNALGFAPTHFARRLDDQFVTTGRERAQRGLAVTEAQLVLSGGTRRSRDTIDRHRLLASAAPPPLAHVLQPLRALAIRLLHVVPDREIGRDAVVFALDPHGDVRSMVFGDLERGDLHGEVHVSGEDRRHRHEAERERQEATHGRFRQWMNRSARTTGNTKPSATIGQVMPRWPACILSRSSPVSAKTTQASAKTSMNQLHTGPVLRPLCRSLR